MKKALSLILFLMFSSNILAQNEKSLEETKAYIIKVITENSWKENDRDQLPVYTFEEDLLKVRSTTTVLGKLFVKEARFNFTTVYRFKGPIKVPGDLGRIIIWADCLPDAKSNKWKKENFDITIINYDLAEQLMIAFKHLNKLLLEKKPVVEKF